MGALLEVENIHANIHQFSILKGVSVDVEAHEITVILGRNGAGKSTTLRTVMGFVRAHQGTIRFQGQDLTTCQPHQVARLGIGYVPEDTNIFANLTVEENLHLGMPRKQRGADERLSYVRDLFPDLATAWRRPAGTLSGGQRQMLALSSVLVTRPPLILIDEPSKGLSPLFVERIGDVLLQIKQESTILLVEQNLYLAGRVGQSVVILDDGQSVYSGKMADLLASDTMQQQYLGVQVAPVEGATS